MAKKRPLNSPRSQKKVSKVMQEFKEGTLRSGSQRGPSVMKRSQAIAIALSEARNQKKKKENGRQRKEK